MTEHREITALALDGHSYARVGHIYDLSASIVGQIVQQYCKRVNPKAYKEALEATRIRRGRDRRYPGADFLRARRSDFLSTGSCGSRDVAGVRGNS